MKLYLVFGGAFIVMATGLYFLYKYNSPIKFQSLKLLDKTSLLHLFGQIRADFSHKFSATLRINRKKRRNLHKGNREYRQFIKDLKDQARKQLQKAMEEVLSKYKITEDLLSDSVKHLENDEDIKKATGKLCSIEVHKAPTSLNLGKLEEILDFYISKAEEFNEDDPNELNIKMKMLEDEIFDQFSYEPEEIEAAVNKYESEVQDLVIAIRELNNALLERTNEELFF